MEQSNEEKVYYTYGMIKPDGMANKEEIIKKILDAGLQIHHAEFDILSDKIIEENYSHCIGRDFYPGMKENLQSGMVLKLLIHDPKGDAVNNYRKVLGATKSWEAEPNTIRGTFGNKQVAYKNVAHGSGNAKEAGEEIIRFFGPNILLLLEALRRDADFRSASNATSFLYQDYDKDKVNLVFTMRKIEEALRKYNKK